MATQDIALDDSSAEGRYGMSGRFYKVTAETKTVLILAVVIFLEQTSFQPIETLQSSLNSQAGLGTYSLACVYGPYCIIAITAPSVVRFLTPKWSIVTQFVTAVIYCISNFYPSWYTLIPASVLTGGMTSALFTAKDLFVSHMARLSTEKNKRLMDVFVKAYQSKLCFYNGIFFAATSLAGVVGQLISSAVLGARSPSVASGEGCGAFNSLDNVFTTNVTNVTHRYHLNQPPKYLVFTLLGILTSLVVLAIALAACCLPNVPPGNKDRSFRTTIFSCAVRCTDTKMLLMIPQMAFFAFPYGLIQSDYTKTYVSCGVGVGMVGYVMISGNLVAAMVSVGCGRLVKYTGRQIQVVVALLGYSGVHLMMWFWTPVADDNIVLYVIIPVVFCASDVIYETHICTIITLMFEEDRAAAFANFYMFRSLFKAISFALSGFVSIWIKLVISIALLCSAAVTFLVLEILFKPGVKIPNSPDDTEEVIVKLNANKSGI